MKKTDKKPIIGITLDSAKNSDKYKYSSFPWYVIRQNYVDCVIQAGGVPILIPYDYDSIDNILEVIDGLIIPGGDEDVNPKFYGKEIISDKVQVNDFRASFDLQITEKALKKNLPFLGICNGMQILNVVLGGTLIQHIPDYIKSDINHEQPSPKDIPSHLINIIAGTLLAKLSQGEESLMVNSSHHQAVEKVGKGLIISAKAPDGIIEAIEATDYKYVIGVEWHPEYLKSSPDFNLFKGLVEACIKKD